MKNIIFAIFTCITFFILLNEKVSSISISTDILTLSIYCVFLYFYYKNSKLVQSRYFNILSIIFTLCMLVGRTFELSGDFTLLYKTKIHILITIISFICYYKFFKVGLSYIYSYLKKYKDKKINIKIKKLFDEHPFIFSFIILFLSYLIYMIAFYPAILSPDPSNQIKQFFKIKTKYLDSVIVNNPNVYITNHHPVFHTILLGGCIKIGLLFSNFNFGLFIYTLLQTFTVIATLSYTISFMRKINTPYIIRCIILVLYAICPIFPFYAMSTVKDTFFSCFVVLYVVELFELLRNKEYKKGQFIRLFLIIIFMFLFRNNGIHVFILSFPVIIFFMKNIIKKNILMLVMCLIFNFGYTKIILPAFNIPNGSIREMLSIPFQQTARYVTNYEDEVTDYEKNIIDKILVYDTLKERYKPNISDPVKQEFNKYATTSDLKEYFIVWARQFVKHPNVYVEATVANTYGYYYPNTTKWYLYYKYDTRLKDAGFDYHYNSLDKLRNYLSDYGNIFKKIPLLGLYVNIGFAFFTILTLFIYVLYERKFYYIPIFLPILTLILVCIASPVNTYFRYAMPYIFTIPILFCICIYIMNGDDISE